MHEPGQTHPEGAQAHANHNEIFSGAETAKELLERSAQLGFEVGGKVTVIVPGGSVEGEVKAVETRPDAHGQDAEYVQVHYWAPNVDRGVNMGTVELTQWFLADTLGRMQIPDQAVDQATPQSDIHRALGGEGTPPSA